MPREDRESERSNSIRFYGSTCILLEQLVSTWSGSVYFTHLYQILSKKKKKLKGKVHNLMQFSIPGRMNEKLPTTLNIYFFYTFSVRLDQSENLIDTFLSASESYTKRIVQAITKPN